MVFCFAWTVTAQEEADLTALESQRPKVVYVVGSVQIAVWENERKGRYGSYTEKNFKIERRYRKDDGTWHSSSYFNESQLLELKAALEKAIMEEYVSTKAGADDQD